MKRFVVLFVATVALALPTNLERGADAYVATPAGSAELRAALAVAP